MALHAARDDDVWFLFHWCLFFLKHVFFCSKLEKQKEKKRKEEQKRKIACLSFTSDGDGDAEENEEEDADGNYGCWITGGHHVPVLFPLCGDVMLFKS